MSKQIKLNAMERKEKNGKANAIRKEGYLPAILYGREVENKAIKVKRGEFEKAYQEAGENTLVDLTIDNSAPVKVLIHDVQKDSIKDQPFHIDFFQVNMKEKVTTEIPLEFVGESRAVKEEGGTFIKNIDALEVECLPADLVSEITVDISVLDNIDDSIKIEDLKLPAGITPLAEGDAIVASVTAVTVEEEPAPAITPDQVEVVEKGKKEEAVSEEKKK